MCRAQHMSAKAWRFQNNLFQLVHSRTVTSIFECFSSASLRSGSTRRTRPAEQRSLEWKRYFEYQTMNLRRDAELASARPSPQQHLRVARALKWHFQLGSIGPLPPDFRQILPPGWSRAIAIIRVTGFHTVAPAVRRNHTRGQRQAMQSHVCCALTVRSRDGVTCSVAKIVITLPFNHMCILCVYVSSHFFFYLYLDTCSRIMEASQPRWHAGQVII